MIDRARDAGPVVLFVDDDADTCAIASEYLAHRGARAIAVRDVPAGLLVVSTTHVDAIVTDFSMPEMDGIALLTALARDPDHRHVPVIMITGHASRPDVQRAAREHGATFLPKPFELTELWGHIEAVTRERRPAPSPVEAVGGARRAPERALAGRGSPERALADRRAMSRAQVEALAAIEASRQLIEAAQRRLAQPTPRPRGAPRRLK